MSISGEQVNVLYASQSSRCIGASFRWRPWVVVTRVRELFRIRRAKNNEWILRKSHSAANYRLVPGCPELIVHEGSMFKTASFFKPNFCCACRYELPLE